MTQVTNRQAVIKEEALRLLDLWTYEIWEDKRNPRFLHSHEEPCAGCQIRAFRPDEDGVQILTRNRGGHELPLQAVVRLDIDTGIVRLYDSSEDSYEIIVTLKPTTPSDMFIADLNETRVRLGEKPFKMKWQESYRQLRSLVGKTIAEVRPGYHVATGRIDHFTLVFTDGRTHVIQPELFDFLETTP